MKLTHFLASLLIATLPVAVVPFTAAAQNATDTTTAPMAPVTDPADFVTKAASGNMFEIESSKLALAGKVDAPVMQFAQKMIDDHSHAGDEMMTAASAAGVTPPTDMTATDKAKITDLTSATNFQAAYVEAQVKAHDDAVALFQSFAENGPDGPLKDFATKTLPTLQQHQTEIHTIAGK